MITFDKITTTKKKGNETMSTRGLFGFRKNGIDKAMYNHYDSYPDYLGRNIVNWLKTVTPEKLNEIFDKIVLVDADEKPSETEKVELDECGLYDYSGEYQEWYSLLHKLQGNPSLIEEIADTYGKVYMCDDISFIKNSLFCEYAYIVNLDKRVLEFWKGFQKKPWSENRYGTDIEENNIRKDYYPCKRISILRFGDIADIPTDSLVEYLNVICTLNEKANRGEK